MRGVRGVYEESRSTCWKIEINKRALVRRTVGLKLELSRPIAAPVVLPVPVDAAHVSPPGVWRVLTRSSGAGMTVLPPGAARNEVLRPSWPLLDAAPAEGHGCRFGGQSRELAGWRQLRLGGGRIMETPVGALHSLAGDENARPRLERPGPWPVLRA